MNPDTVSFEPDEMRRIRRVIYSRWLGISLTEWDSMSYRDQCDVIEIKRAFDTNTEYTRNIRSAR